MKRIVVFALVLLVMCSAFAKYQSKKVPVVEMGLRNIPSPSWVFGPNVERDDYIYFKGDAKNISESLARARSELECATRAARQIGQAVTYAIDDVQKEMAVRQEFGEDASGLNVSGTIQKAQSRSTVMLKGLELLDEWWDKDGRIYVLMGMPLETYENMLNDLIKEAIPESKDKSISKNKLNAYNMAKAELEDLFVSMALDKTEELVDVETE